MARKRIYLLFIIASAAIFAACEVQSGISKKSVEKYVQTPTPEIVAPAEEPIDPSDVVEVDTSLEGPQITINDAKTGRPINCDRYNRVSLNVDDGKLNLRGACERITVNGNRNQISFEAASSVHVNGNGNTIRHTKFVNGKRPQVNDNGQENLLEKAPSDEKK